MRGHVIDASWRARRFTRLALVMAMIGALVAIASPASAAHVAFVVESGGSTDVTEGGSPDTYTVALDDQPTADVEVTVSVLPAAQVRVAGDQLSVVLTFDDVNWATPQEVSVTAFDDDVVEGSHLAKITLS